MSCPCGSNKQFADCCLQIHNDLKNAKTAELLMRARYSAFAKHNIDFLFQTFHPTTRQFQNKNDIKNWALENKWMQLEIIKSTPNTVEFKAHYLDQDLETQIHHEKSNFKKSEDMWYYVDGEIVD